MDNTKKKERLERHIEALEKSYENLLSILNEDLEKDEAGKSKLKDTQKKIYSEGVNKSAETASNLLDMINRQQAELDEINSPKKRESKKAKVAEASFPIERHLK